jgi:hypothetical protein
MAAAVTPTLFISTGTPMELPHVEAESPTVAASEIENGNTVVVPDSFTAMKTLIMLGMAHDEVDRRIAIALNGPDYRGAADPAAPVPLAPGAARP